MSVASILVFVFALQDEAEFGRGLAELGFIDLAEEILGRGPQSEDSELALLQAKVSALQALDDRKERLDGANALAEQLRAWLRRRPESPKALDATELLAECLQTAGKTHALNREFPEAEAAYGEAIQVLTSLAEKLKTAPGADLEVRHDRLLLANYLALRASMAKIDALKEHPNARATIQEMLSGLRLPIDDFLLSYEFNLASQDILVRTSRAYQTLAELQWATRDPIAERTLSVCFDWTRKTQLLSIPGGEKVRELAARLVEHEMSANNFYASLLRARNAKDFKKRFDLALAKLEKLYSLYPELRSHELGIGPRVESAKALIGLGKTAEGIQTIRSLLKEFRDPRLCARIIISLGEFVGFLDLSDRMEIAQFVFDCGDLVFAARQFQEIRASGGAAHFGRCTLRIGQCYYLTRRYVEAAHAFRELMDPKFAEAPEAAILLSRCLRALGRNEEADEHDAFMLQKGWGTHEMIRNQAIEKERQGLFSDAIPLWEKLSKEAKLAKMQVEATARIGYDHVRLSEKGKPEEHWHAARAAFREVLTRSADADSDDLLMTLVNGSAVMLRLARTPEEVQEVLDMSKDALDRFPNARPDFLVLILARRVEAQRTLRRPADAETEFKELRAYFKKVNAGISHYHRALEALVQTFRDAKMFDKEREYILELPQARDYEHVKMLAESSFQAGRFAEARDLFEKLLGAYAKDIQADKDSDMELKIRYRIVKCHMAEGRLEQAAQAIDLMRSDDLEVRELRADILYETAIKQTGNERVQSMKTAAGLFSNLALKYKKADPEAYYRTLYKKYRALFEFSDGQTQLRALFDYAKTRGEVPSWGESGSKDALNQLMKLMDEKIPSKN